MNKLNLLPSWIKILVGEVNNKQIKLHMCPRISHSGKYQEENKVWCPKRQEKKRPNVSNAMES